MLRTLRQQLVVRQVVVNRRVLKRMSPWLKRDWLRHPLVVRQVVVHRQEWAVKRAFRKYYQLAFFWTEYGASEWTVWFFGLEMLPVNGLSGIVMRVI
jgi:hypothetical protein